MGKQPRAHRRIDMPIRPGLDVETTIEEALGLSPGVCDFCSERDRIAVCYPTVVVTTISNYWIVGSDGVSRRYIQDNVDGWAACAACRAYVDANHWERLASRVVDVSVARLPELNRPDARAHLRGQLLDFWREAFISAWPRWIDDGR